MKSTTEKKLRGAFYTPSAIAKFVLKWAINGDRNYDILEPCCGDGSFLRQIQKNDFAYKSITAVEIDPLESKKARNLRLLNAKIINGDFYHYCNVTNDRFDLIIGNPPFIRHRYFEDKQRDKAEKIFAKMNLKYSRMMNPWVSFIAGSSMLLRKKGKIGFVVPAEIFQVSYAKELRNFLSHFYNKISIISFRKLVFPKAQQEVVLLLCEKDQSKKHQIEHLQVDTNNDDLEKIDVSRIRHPRKKIDFESNKWTFYFLKQYEIDFIENILSIKSVRQMRDFAKVEVGITTGFNRFFSIRKSTMNEFGLEKYVMPMVGKSASVPGIIFEESDWEFNAENDACAYLLTFPTRGEISGKPLAYIKNGERKGIQNLYKCSIRNEWQIVPSVWESDALFLRRINICPKFTLNSAGALTTDTMHRVTVNKNRDVITDKKISPKSLIASYYNSLSLAFTEINGRSHGGGALELMPNEVEDIPIPYHEQNYRIFPKIDAMIRDRVDVDKILEYTDEVILKKGFGFSESEIRIANNIWKKLLKRRLGRANNRNR